MKGRKVYVARLGVCGEPTYELVHASECTEDLSNFGVGDTMCESRDNLAVVHVAKAEAKLAMAMDELERAKEKAKKILKDPLPELVDAAKRRVDRQRSN